MEGSGSTIIKSASVQERQFYETVGPRLSEDLIGIWTAAFYGTLRLEGKMNSNSEIEFIPSTEVKEVSSLIELQEERELILAQMLVLENLTYRFLRPNVLDIKLGTQLYDDNADEAKKARMIESSLATTSSSTGMRITGFQVSSFEFKFLSRSLR